MLFFGLVRMMMMMMNCLSLTVWPTVKTYSTSYLATKYMYEYPTHIGHKTTWNFVLWGEHEEPLNVWKGVQKGAPKKGAQ